jgi:hypothetical protein
MALLVAVQTVEMVLQALEVVVAVQLPILQWPLAAMAVQV